MKQLAPGGVLGDREWYVFVHRPSDVRSYEVKAVVGAEVGQIPESEVVPRLTVLAEQLAPGQTLEVTGLEPPRAEIVQSLLKRQLGIHYEIDEPQPARKSLVLRIKAEAKPAA
ncbi:MAG: hypothetical protein JO020_12855 [Chloroflexi bacterium]|nr:hypothetical protein [Chloroflexota bacterium]MBV9895051.1 hypothetical protein [Chloroflexota bacterium]